MNETPQFYLAAKRSGVRIPLGPQQKLQVKGGAQPRSRGRRICFGVERLTSAGAFDMTFSGIGYTHTIKAPAASDVRVFGAKIIVACGQYVAGSRGSHPHGRRGRRPTHRSKRTG